MIAHFIYLRLLSAFEVSGRCPSSDQGVDQNLALLLFENLAVGVRAKKTGQDGLESADGHTAVVGRGDKFGERRQPRARAAGKVCIDLITNERDRTMEAVVGRYEGDLLETLAPQTP